MTLQVREEAQREPKETGPGIFLSKPSFSISTPTKPPYLLTQKENRTPQSSVIGQAPRAPLCVAVLLRWWIFFFFFLQHNLSGCAHTRCGQGWLGAGSAPRMDL